MKERDDNYTLPQDRRALVQLTNVPVDLAYTRRLLTLLEAHGAKATHTNTKQRLSAEGMTSTYHEYTIDFPAGTQREDGLSLSRSVPFTIYFPDGYELPAVEFSSTNAPPGEKSLIILHILR